MEANFAYLASFGKQNFCQYGRGGKLPFGQTPQMANNRIKELRTAKQLTLDELAERTGLSPGYVQRLESGKRNLGFEHLEKFATALEVTERELIPDETDRSAVVRVVGKIGAGQEILPEAEQVPPEGLKEIEVPFPVPDTTLAFEVDGDSMWPRYDPGDVILCWREGTNFNEVIGWEAAVRTSNGRRYLKRIVRGSKAKLFNLESFNAPVIRDVKLEWISKVQLVVRAGEWKQLGRAVQNRVKKKLAAAARR